MTPSASHSIQERRFVFSWNLRMFSADCIEHFQKAGVLGRDGLLDLGGGNPETGFPGFDLVEFMRVPDQRLVAVLAHGV